MTNEKRTILLPSALVITIAGSLPGNRAIAAVTAARAAARRFLCRRSTFSCLVSRATSRKIKPVVQAKGNEGKRLTNVPIYGYRLDPDDKTKWIIDDEAAEVIRRIFRMTIEGSGPQIIAKKLAADNVERPSYQAG